MRHKKDTVKLQRTSSHRRAMFANMTKSLVVCDRIKTTLPKAKQLRRFADKMVTLAKKNTLASRRQAIAKLQVAFNKLTPAEARRAKQGDKRAYNTDRQVIEKLFDTLGPRFAKREGGYTRIIKTGTRVGDKAQTCFIEWVDGEILPQEEKTAAQQ